MGVCNGPARFLGTAVVIVMRLIQLQSLLFLTGCIVAAEGGLMLLPALADIDAHQKTWSVFATSALVTSFVGMSVALAMRGSRIDLNARQTFLLTSMIWVSATIFGALPFFLWRPEAGIANAVFETASGLTTTGSTVLTGLDQLPRGILLWRALLQFFGGVGIVVLAAALLPVLRVGGMQLFKSESSDRSQKVFAHMRHIAISIIIVYFTLVALCMIAYDAAGMGLFDALAHAMATVSTGGFSTSDASLANWPDASIQWICILFMLLGALPFPLYVRFAQGKPDALWRDPQVHFFLVLIAFISAMLIVLQTAAQSEQHLSDTIRHSVFATVSILSTTGFATQDYQLWGPAAAAIILVITFIGGCTGSTAGGLKIFRLQMLLKILRQQMDTLLYPHGHFPIIHHGRALTGSNEILLAVVTFTIAYFGLVTVAGTLLAATGLDLVSSFTAAATAVANVGPGLGPIVGPAGNFSSLGDFEKFVLSAAMIMGRLEIMTVLVVFSPYMWRD